MPPLLVPSNHPRVLVVNGESRRKMQLELAKSSIWRHSGVIRANVKHRVTAVTVTSD